MSLTIALNHEGLNNVVTNHLKVGVTNPVADGGFRSSEEIVEDGDFMTQEHQTVYEMRANEAGASSNEDALAVGWSKESNGSETSEGRVRDGVGIRMINRLGLILSVPLGKLGVLGLLVVGRRGCSTLTRHRDIMGAQVESTKVVDGNLAVETESIETDGSDLFAVLVQGHDALKNKNDERAPSSAMKRRTEGAMVVVMVVEGEGWPLLLKVSGIKGAAYLCSCCPVVANFLLAHCSAVRIQIFARSHAGFKFRKLHLYPYLKCRARKNQQESRGTIRCMCSSTETK